MKEKILIISDVEKNSNILLDLLNEQYEIVNADSDGQGFALLKDYSHEIKLILIDIPLISPLCKNFLKIKSEMAEGNDIPVIVIYDKLSESEQISGLKLGVNEFLNRNTLPEILKLRIQSLIEQNIEIVEAKSEVKSLKNKLIFDDMTGVLNKTNTEIKMNKYLEENEGTLDVMMVVDIDHFKQVNDTLGHQAGDKIIQIVVKIITDLLRKTDFVGRVGGDEFCLLMKDVPNMDIVYSKVSRLCQFMKYKPNLEIPDYVSVSVGITQNGREKRTYAAMFEEADEALYMAKNNGKARYCEYGVPIVEEEYPDDSFKQESALDCILVVDDDHISRKITRKLLGSLYNVIEAENGLEAIRMIKENKIDVIILDLIMPIMDGYQFMENIKRNDDLQPIPVIVLTASNIQENDLRILSLGADIVLHKPINAGMLIQYVKNQVERYKQHKKEVQKYNAHKAMMNNSTKAFLCTYHFDTQTAEVGHEYLRFFNVDFPKAFERYPFDVERFVLETQLEEARAFFNVKDSVDDNEKIELRLKISSLEYSWFEVDKLYNFDKEGKIKSVMFMFLNIEHSVKAREKLIFLANNDMLTHIPNVHLFASNVEELLASQNSKKYVVISVDISQFRIINKVFGRKEGDAIIKFVANRIQEAVEGLESGAYCRESADVFFMCVPEDEHLFGFIERLKKTVRSYPINFHIHLCFGIYKISNYSESINDMMDHSSFARQKAKDNPSVTLKYYDGEMKKEETFENVAVAEMENAMKTEQFHVYYQPKCDIHTGKIVGAEALIRWIHPREGFLSPMYFIPVFEQNGSCIELDYYVYKQVCKMLRKRLDNGEKVVPVSVNVSRWSLYNKMLTKNICKLVDGYNIPHEYIEFEITEGAFVLDSKLLSRFSMDMREMGFKINIDDFGSGYSSLNTLKEVPFDVLKLDMKFLDDIDKNKNAETILSSVVNMGKGLGLTILAEGVETQEQLDILKNLGCCYVQGYFFYKPLPLEDFEHELTINGI